jgi:hypothetical protein
LLLLFLLSLLMMLMPVAVVNVAVKN